MSLLWRDALRVGVSPERLLFARYRRGPRSRLEARDSLPVPAEASTPAWMPALHALRRALPERAGSADTTVILSNQFVRYALLPWRKELKSNAEWLAFARHGFSSTYGSVASDWDIRVSPERAGHGRLASAIDCGLIPELLAVCKAAGARPVSIQPHFMSAFNRSKAFLGSGAAWFAVSEPGRLAFGMLRAGYWQVVRSRKMSAEGASFLDPIERETALSASEDCLRIVYLGEADPAGTLPSRYKIEDLTVRAGEPFDARGFAMVLA